MEAGGERVMAGITRRFRLVGQEPVCAARITASAFFRRAGRAAVLRGLVLVVASATAVVSFATPSSLASNGATLPGPGGHRALGRADAAGSPQPAGPLSRAVRPGAGTGRGAYPAAFAAAVSGTGQPARQGLAVFSSAD